LFARWRGRDLTLGKIRIFSKRPAPHYAGPVEMVEIEHANYPIVLAGATSAEQQPVANAKQMPINMANSHSRVQTSY